MREYVLAQRGDDPFGRRREQEDLDEIHDALQREQADQAERHAIEQRTVVLLEGGIEEMPHHLRERESDRCRYNQAERRNREPSAERTESREQLAERFW